MCCILQPPAQINLKYYPSSVYAQELDITAEVLLHSPDTEMFVDNSITDAKMPLQWPHETYVASKTVAV